MNVAIAHCGISGFESPAAQYTQQTLSLDALLISRPTSTFFAIASGRSMERVGIFDGDILVVDRSPIPNHQDVVVSTINGNFNCKILDKINRQLVAADDVSAPVAIDEGDEFIIEGIVISSIRCHRPIDLSACSL